MIKKLSPCQVGAKRMGKPRLLAASAAVRAVSDEGRKFGADHVLAVPRWKRALLHRRYCIGIRVQGQSGILQISVPHHGVPQAHELFFSAARLL